MIDAFKIAERIAQREVRRCGRPEWFEDFAQVGKMSIFRFAHKWNQEGDFGAFCSSLAAYAIHQAARDWMRWPISGLPTEQRKLLKRMPQVEDWDRACRPNYERRLDAQLINFYFGFLEDRERRVLEMRLAGAEQAEIAEIVGLKTHSAISKIESRAIAKIRVMLQVRP